FRLAQLDPQGNCTKGITRTVSELTNDGTQDMKDLIDWPRDKYLNVWVAASADGAAGYAMFPGSVDGNWGEGADGIVILHNYVGSIGTSSNSHSRALTHEIGHWLNLMHTWGWSNDPAQDSNCGMSDGVNDTPTTIGWTTCNLNGASCGSPLDNVENYMEYSYCSKMFTEGQKNRMIAALNSDVAERSNLSTPENLAATGTAGAQQLCAASFSTNQRVICAGESITFTDDSYNGVTQRAWSFTGGDPAASTEVSQVVTYATPGTYNVDLSAGNGTETVSTTGTVVVLPATGQPLPFSEGFEGVNDLTGSNWTVVNPDGANTWELRTGTAYTGDHSVRLRNIGNEPGQMDELISNTIDLGNDSVVTLTFRYAFARRNTSNDDYLQVWISHDCGRTWSLRRQMRGENTLPTVPDQGAAFTPTSQGQWQQAVLNNVVDDFLVSNFRMKFVFISDGGNDLWLDDINITSGGTNVGLEELPGLAGASLMVVPNPAGNEAVVMASLSEAGNVQVDVLDPLGRLVAHVAQGRVAAGPQRWALPVEALRSGLYLVRVQQGSEVRVVRFTKN
ncbi:MAG TPA: M43 family zinc metalloprotease, partial [Flavobacteriales bacterium]|nr:M43 family zinc metalloprotease [Flavobacteriales bacterium]